MGAAGRTPWPGATSADGGARCCWLRPERLRKAIPSNLPKPSEGLVAREIDTALASGQDLPSHPSSGPSGAPLESPQLMLMVPEAVQKASQAENSAGAAARPASGT